MLNYEKRAKLDEVLPVERSGTPGGLGPGRNLVRLLGTSGRRPILFLTYPRPRYSLGQLSPLLQAHFWRRTLSSCTSKPHTYILDA